MHKRPMIVIQLRRKTTWIRNTLSHVRGGGFPHGPLFAEHEYKDAPNTDKSNFIGPRILWEDEE